MINKTQRKRILKVIGSRYTQGVIDILNKRNIYNREGKPFSPGFISHVMNGIRVNIDVENAILDYYQKCLLIQQKHELKKIEILENKKPEAATPGK